MAETPFVETRLPGFFQPDYAVGDRVLFRPDEGAPGMLGEADFPTIAVHDARALQERASAQPGFSEAAFYEEHGFVLLEHESAVEDWDVDPAIPDPENELNRIYHPEIETLIRTRLLPGERLEIFQGPPTRRGPGTLNPEYANGVHQDFGVSPDDFQEGFGAFTGPEIAGFWRMGWDREEVRGFQLIDFWRTAGMEGALLHMPLAVCAPASVRFEDVVPAGIEGITPTGKPTNQLCVRFHPDQRWYYYPRMKPDEVLAFKNWECRKDDAPGRLRSCFHSAFDHPGTPADAPVRQSSEHRVSVFRMAEAR